MNLDDLKVSDETPLDGFTVRDLAATLRGMRADDTDESASDEFAQWIVKDMMARRAGFAAGATGGQEA